KLDLVRGLNQSLHMQIDIRVIQIRHGVFQVVSIPECARMCPDRSEEFGIFATQTHCPKTSHRKTTNGPAPWSHVEGVRDVLAYVLDQQVFIFLAVPFTQASGVIQVEKV